MRFFRKSSQLSLDLVCRIKKKHLNEFFTFLQATVLFPAHFCTHIVSLVSTIFVRDLELGYCTDDYFGNQIYEHCRIGLKHYFSPGSPCFQNRELSLMGVKEFGDPRRYF